MVWNETPTHRGLPLIKKKKNKQYICILPVLKKNLVLKNGIPTKYISMNAANHLRMNNRHLNITPKTHKQLRASGQGCQTPLWAEGEVSHLHMEIMMAIA